MSCRSTLEYEEPNLLSVEQDCIPGAIDWFDGCQMCFAFALTMFLVAAWIAAKQNEYYGTILAIPTAAAVLLSGIAYPCTLTVRDMLDRGQLPRRFSLWQLLSLLTSVSITLGLLVLLLKGL